MTKLVTDQAELQDLCRRIRSCSATVHFDTEFITERRYTPQLCLVQILIEPHDGENEDALLDPFELDLRPLTEIIADPAFTKVLHSGEQDLQILFQQYECKPQSTFDTQIAAAFLGYGQQAGYADLVKRVADGPQISKSSQYSDWAARPLSDEQLEYARLDVVYLPRIYATLWNELEERGRLGWAQAEFHRAEKKCSTEIPPDELYLKLNRRGLNRRQLGILRELAAWRNETAREANKPLGSIAPDPALVQIAKQAPEDANRLRNMRGAPRLNPRQTEAVLNAVKCGSQVAEDDLPQLSNGRKPDPEAEAIGVLLGLAVNLRAEESDIARNYLGSRDDLTRLAKWWCDQEKSNKSVQVSPPEDLKLLHDWRRELIGDDLLKILHGEMAVAVEDNRAVTVPVS